MANDMISDMLTRLRNANLAKQDVIVLPFSQLRKQICELLKQDGLIDSFQVETSNTITVSLRYLGRTKIPCITNLRRISKPGLRVYVNNSQVPRLLAGRCLVVISTSKGIMSDRQARNLGLGGEVLCAIW